MDYTTAPIWNDCPKTCTLAKPKQTKQVKNVDVIEVHNAYYRGAEFSGVFEITPNTFPNLIEGKQRIEVNCCWFGHRLKTRGIKMLVDNTNGNAVIKRNYNGTVVCNLAK